MRRTVQNIKVAIAQFNCSYDESLNIQKANTWAEKAADEGCKLLVFPELHTLPYFCITQDVTCFNLAETLGLRRTESVLTLSHHYNMVVIATIFEKAAPGLFYNTAIVAEKGRLVGSYRKSHIPQDPGYEEKYYFTPGQSAYHPIETSIGKIGLLICWDQWFPEPARLMALAGADLLVYPSAIGWDPKDSESVKRSQLDSWITVQRGHAIANVLPVLFSNRVGKEEDREKGKQSDLFWGNSHIVGADGQILSHGNSEQETLVTAELNLEQSQYLRKIWPFFRDRRVDLYKPLLKSHN